MEGLGVWGVWGVLGGLGFEFRGMLRTQDFLTFFRHLAAHRGLNPKHRIQKTDSCCLIAMTVKKPEYLPAVYPDEDYII